MSKSKDQCIHIIAKRFNGVEDEENPKVLSIIMEESIKEISESEYGLFWIYEKDTLVNLSNNLKINMTVGTSLFKSVLEVQRSFFDNHIASHKFYNQLVDNPFNIKIKSMLIVPLMDRVQEKVVGFISVFNSVNNGGEFQRYDIRSVTLLNSYALKIIALRNAKENNLPLPHFNNDILVNSSNNERKILVRSEIKPKERIEKKRIEEEESFSEEILKLQNELKELTLKSKEERDKNEQMLSESQKKLERFEKDLIDQSYRFEKELLRKDKIIEELEETTLNHALVVEEKEEEKHDEIVNIVKFLANEVSYLADESHHVYLFLELIKNSLYNKEQLLFIEEMLKESELVSFLANELYTREKMPVFLYEFNAFQSFYSIANLYARAISSDNITYNVFIDPSLPVSLISDEDKLKSIIVHLMNNIRGLIKESGLIECIIQCSEINETLEIKIQGFNPKEKIKNKKLFKQKESTSHSLVSGDKGLGLSVSSGLIHHLEGKLKLETLEEDGKAFSVLLPVQIPSLLKKQKFLLDNQLKIGILMNEENEDAYKNLERYFEAFEILPSHIIVFETHRQISQTRLTHLFCFENMYDKSLKEKNISEIILLKHSTESFVDAVHELYYNGYYGRTLQKILFPDMEIEELEIETELVNDSFLTKLNKVVKRLKVSS